MGRSCCCSKKCVYVVGFLGAFLIVLGGVLIVVVDMVIGSTVESDTVLVEGTAAFDSWRETPTPVYMQYYVWNLENKENFLNGEVPIFKEQGPYTYREVRRKTNITFDDEEGTVRFRNYKAYLFEPDKSFGLENDIFTTVDLLSFTVGHLAKYNEFLKYLQKAIHGRSKSEVIVDVTVGGFLWGYTQPYLVTINELLELISEIQIPEEFGLFIGTNDTTFNEWVVYTGQTGLSNVNQIKSWNNLTSLEYWTTEYANALNGTDGQAFHPYIQTNEALYIFVPDICRSGIIEYTGPNELLGVPTAKFTAPAFQYAGAEEYPDNIGFCTPDETGCTPNGLLNATTCNLAPVFYSSPHFLYGSEGLLESVVGMNPIKEQHQVDVDIEMLTGVTLQVSNRLQINLKVEAYRQLSQSWDIPTTYFPFFWLNESSVLDEALAEVFKSDVQNIMLYANVAVTFLMSVGCGMFVGFLYIMLKEYMAKKRPSPVDDGEEMVTKTRDNGNVKQSTITTRYDHEYENDLNDYEVVVKKNTSNQQPEEDDD